MGKKKILAAARLYLVLDRQVASYDQLFDIMIQTVPAGVDLVQLRDKMGHAQEIAYFCSRALRFLRGRVPFIINDRIDIAKWTKVDGVHLGQDDVPLSFARKMLGPKAIIGVSAQTMAQARQAERDGANYLGFGSVFKTLTKPQRQEMDLRLLVNVFGAIKIPVFAIGGIDAKNVRQLTALGVDRIAVIRAICEAKDVAAATKTLKDVLRLK